MAADTLDIRSLWNFSNPKQSREVFQNKINEVSDSELKFELKTQIARTLGLEAKFDEAHKYLNELEKEIKPEMKKAMTRYFLERGRVYNSSGKKEEAIKEFLKSFELAKAINFEYLIVDAAHMLAIANKEFSEQKKWTEIAIENAKSAKDQQTKDWMGSLLNNWGWSLFDQKKFEQALIQF